MRRTPAHPSGVTPLIRRPPAVTAAALLARVCAIVLIAVAIAIAERGTVSPGALAAVTALSTAAALLVLAAAAAWRRVDQVLLVVVLGVITISATASATISLISGGTPELAAGIAMSTCAGALLLLRRTLARLWDPRLSRGRRGSAASHARATAAAGTRR